MVKKTIFTGRFKRIELGSRGNRYKMLIDNIELSEWVKEEIADSVIANKLGKNKILQLKDFLYGEEIEVKIK